MSELVEEGSDAAKIVDEENTLHTQVQDRVRAGANRAKDSLAVSDLDRDLIEMRDAISEAKPEDLAPLVEQMTRLAALRSRLGKGKDLPLDINSPYFAHMVLKSKDKVRDVLIGKRGLIDRDANVQIVDWRNAPVSQIYYRYDEGDDYDEEVGGVTLTGDVLLKRNVSIQRSVLRRIGAPQGTFVLDGKGSWHVASGASAPTLQGGSGTAARAPKAPTVSKHGKKSGQRGKGREGRPAASGNLGVHSGALQRADKHLPEIAALIDKSQFDLITQPESGLVVIQGGAGSGKTTVALHRIAFLNFADGKRFRANKILFVVPGNALVRYVQSVLPALGVRGVPVVTFSGWAQATRIRLLPGTKRKYNDDTPESVTRIKKHPAMLAILDEYVAEQVAEAEEELASLPHRAEAVLGQWYEMEKVALVPRLRNLFRWLRTSNLNSEARIAAESRIKYLGQRANDTIEDWADVMTDEGRLWRHLEAFGVRKSSIASTVRWCLDQELESPGEVDDRVSDLDGRKLEEDSRSGYYDQEDDPLLLRLIQLKRGALSGKKAAAISFSHVAIDEAQDRSAVEVKILLDATEAESTHSKEKSVTIAGDTAQRLVFDNGFKGWDDLLTQTGNSSVVVHPLKLSYRSTAEVMALARDILGPKLAPADPLVARSGAPVELHQFGDVGEAVAFLAESLRALVNLEPGASIAVLARYPEQADMYYEGLRRAEVIRMRRVQRDEFSFEPGIDVTDATQVKGLEFDYVIMVDVNTSTYPETDECRHLMHIAATRAAYQLWLISTSEPSKLLPAALREF